MPHSLRPISRFFQLFRIIDVLLVMVLLLAGCSAVKLGYNTAPELSYWWLDSYLDFNETQSLKVRADLAALQAWHRSSELPAYVSTLEKLQRMAPSDVTPEQVCNVLAELKSYVQPLIDQAEPIVVAVAPTLTAEQLDHLARQLTKRSQKWREKWLGGTLAERNSRRLKQLTDRTDMLYGPLEEPQLVLLRASVMASAFDASLNFHESLRRHQDALQSLRQLRSANMSAPNARAEVRALLERSMNSPDAAYQAYVKKITQESCTTIASLHNSTTPAQRLKVIDTLKDYALDARTLMAQKR